MLLYDVYCFQIAPESDPITYHSKIDISYRNFLSASGNDGRLQCKEFCWFVVICWMCYSTIINDRWNKPCMHY